MARISAADPATHGLLNRLFVKFVYRAVKRKLGKLVMPVQIVAHHPKVLWGYGQMEQAQSGSHLVDVPLKCLAELRVATLIGCPF